MPNPERNYHDPKPNPDTVKETVDKLLQNSGYKPDSTQEKLEKAVKGLLSAEAVTTVDAILIAQRAVACFNFDEFAMSLEEAMAATDLNQIGSAVREMFYALMRYLYEGRGGTSFSMVEAAIGANAILSVMVHTGSLVLSGLTQFLPNGENRVFQSIPLPPDL